ncbi:uncharacterized protein LY79DRAFT_505313, partial [Colletotrichum navitas]
FQMMENNEASNALLTQAADRLDAATKALMKEKDEFALAKEQLLEKGTEFASINVELEKAMAAVEELVAIQCNNFANYDNPLNTTPTSSSCSGMGIFDPQEIASFQMDLHNEKNELEAVKIALNDAFSDINLAHGESDVKQNGDKGNGQYGLEQKTHASGYPNTNGTIETQAKEREDLKASIIEELKKELKKELKTEIKAELKSKLKNKLKAKVTDLKADIMTELKTELKEELIEYINSNIKHEFIKHEIKDAVSHEMADCVKPRLFDEIYEDMREALQRIDDKEEELQRSFDEALHRLNLKSDKLEKKMENRMDEKLGARSVQGWNETRDKKHQTKMRAKKVTAVPSQPYLKSEGSIVDRCVAANACDWGAWGAETPDFESEQERSSDTWGEPSTAKVKKADSWDWGWAKPY